MARFLVTGGCGFIGSHLADALVARGHRVRILDNLSTGKRDNAPVEAELVIGDITDSPTLEKCVEGMDGVFHLAAIASVEQSRRDWLGCHAINVTGTVRLFEAARKAAKPPRIVYASSAAVYGDNPASPLGEGDMPRPITAYGADKLGCELHGRVATLLHGVPTVGLRFFNVFGARQDPFSPYSGVISIFVERLRRKAPIDVFGDGRQVRDFVAVDDVVEFLLAAMSTRDGLGEVFNVCTGRGTTVLTLAETLGAVLGVSPEIRHAAQRAGDIRSSVGDPSAAERVLGKTARLSLHEGLARMNRCIAAAA